jgi:hypothetical protein
MYSNQFSITIEGRFETVVFDDFVQIGNDEKQKVQAIISAKGEEHDSDEILVTFWGKAADRAVGIADGTDVRIDAKIFTKEVERKDGSGTLFITEVVGYFIKEVTTRREQRERFERGSGAPERTREPRREPRNESTRSSDEKKSPRTNARRG